MHPSIVAEASRLLSFVAVTPKAVPSLPFSPTLPRSDPIYTQANACPTSHPAAASVHTVAVQSRRAHVSARTPSHSTLEGSTSLPLCWITGSYRTCQGNKRNKEKKKKTLNADPYAVVEPQR
ncbi:hypothetical protein CTA1_7815 [Colletotrichum tanaceti]|uniref:Uncharacterized protein n=1 Tax=Colletotrichum tanaceti TaxID=1306861 RepID=A0A4U6XNN0_9PEZI|nr:hypothetical protein CTA1_7815 [Colletotrichum tanaceti]